MANVWKQFEQLLPDERITIGDVESHNSDGTSTVVFLNGERSRPIGQAAAVGKKALLQRGKVIGEAPDLPQYDLTIP